MGQSEQSREILPEGVFTTSKDSPSKEQDDEWYNQELSQIANDFSNAFITGSTAAMQKLRLVETPKTKQD